ncbi:MAG: T9SS type A sorting domain-containing protein, partial [Bacteroidales bacterium]|nr:T9SS type A sorting domain-containing protein [Bacteroidales bacterium]
CGLTIAQKNPTAIYHYEFSSSTDSLLFAITTMQYNNNKLVESVYSDIENYDTIITRHMYDAQGIRCYSVILDNGDTSAINITNNNYSQRTSDNQMYVMGETELELMMAIYAYGVSDYSTTIPIMGLDLYPCDSFEINMGNYFGEDMPFDKLMGYPYKNQAGDIDSIAIVGNMGFYNMNIGYITATYDNNHNNTSWEFIISIPSSTSVMSMVTEYNNNNKPTSVISCQMEEGCTKITYAYKNNTDILYVDNYTEGADDWELSSREWYVYEVSVEEAQINAVTCYPNPTGGVVNIQSETDGIMHIYDIHGRQMMQTDITAGMNTINMQAFASGCYFIKFVSDNHIQTLKVIKQ